MAKSKQRMNQEVNAGSMADIAFLLLIFFLVTTTIATDKGLTILLPPKKDDMQEIDVKIQERNIFKVLVNSKDMLLVNNEPLDRPEKIREMLKAHVLNFGKPNEEALQTYNSLPQSLKSMSRKDPKSSDHPGNGGAVVSFKSDRGTSYEMYIKVLDELQAAYFEIYAERVGITADQFRSLDRKDPRQKKMYDEAREGIPMNISIAEPSNIGG
jgi:biopolymer transport protein ExbD